MRIVKDIVGDVQAGGNTIHHNVRVLQDDKKRVAVFNGRGAPVNVYGPDEVTFTITRRPCACKGDPGRITMMRLWEQAERAASAV